MYSSETGDARVQIAVQLSLCAAKRGLTRTRGGRIGDGKVQQVSAVADEPTRRAASRVSR